MTVAELVASIFYETDSNSKAKAEKTASETAENISEAFSKTFGTIKQAAVQALSVLGIGISLKALNQTAEEYGNINDKIRAATKELGNQEEIQKKILDTANETRLFLPNCCKPRQLLFRGFMKRLGLPRLRVSCLRLQAWRIVR